MNYIIYKTINLITGMIYVGLHKQIGSGFDGYLGSGKWFRRSIKFHGKENFTRETLFSFTSKNEAYDKEKEIVTKEFISLNTNYNLKEGGKGGWDYINSSVSILNKRVQILTSKFGNPCGQMHTVESQAKRLRTNTVRYGSPNAIIHSKESRCKAEASRCKQLFDKGLNRNHFLNSTLAIDKAKQTRVHNTKLRSIKKYPELNLEVTLLSPNGDIVIKDILINVSMYLFGKSKGTSNRNRLISLINGEEFNFRSKWYNYTAYFSGSSETIP